MNKEAFSPNNNYAIWGLFGTLAWGFIIAITFIVTQIFAMGLYVGFNYPSITISEYENLILGLQYNGTVLSICTLASLLICGPLILGVIKLKKNSNLKHYLGLKTVDASTLRYWVLVIICLVVASDLLTLLIGNPLVPEFMSTIYQSAEFKWMFWLALIIVAPLLEELFFRGFLFTGLSYSIVGPIASIIVSAAAWAAIHLQYDFYGMITIFVVGVVLGIARYKSESVLLTIGLHSLLNLIATLETAIYTS